jgi:hypothetical protein
MSAIYDAHFEAMQESLRKCREGGRRSIIAVGEMRLAIAWRYRLQLPLEDPSISPVTYWRWQWPLFECEVKYQELRYTLALCPPRGTAEEQRALVLEESCRRIRHIELKPGLFGYIQSGRANRDFQLFGNSAVAAHRNSEWLAGLWAFDRYDRFLEARFPCFTQNYHPGGSAPGPL